jgi:DNA-binding MarR family transcriptional regulator
VTAAPAAGERLGQVSLVADTFVELARSFTRAKAKWLAQAEHDVEWSAAVILRALEMGGPARSGTLAERIDSDPSTVSRQVTSLVDNGLLTRQADPVDGRASLLVLTDKANAVLAEHNEIRLQHFAQMLDDWSERDLARFAELLRRFTDDYERANASWVLPTHATAKGTR